MFREEEPPGVPMMHAPLKTVVCLGNSSVFRLVSNNVLLPLVRTTLLTNLAASTFRVTSTAAKAGPHTRGGGRAARATCC